MSPNQNSISVYVVDDSEPIRQRIVTMLSTMPRVRVVGESGNAQQAIDEILNLEPDFVLLDLNLGTSSGMDVLRAVHPKLPATRFVVLTNHTEPQYARACIRAGASHFLDKSAQFDAVPALITMHSTML